MAILPRNSDYTAKDFDSLRVRLIALLKSVFPTWTDFNTANFGTLLAEMWCWTGDALAYYQDNNAAESRIVTAQQRRNLLALVKLLGYAPEGASAAQADLNISVDGTLAATCVIPAGQIIRTKTGDLPFQLLAPLTLTTGTPSGTATAENSTTETKVYAGTGLPNQSVVLGVVPFLSVVSVDDGAGYAEVDNFLFSSATDRHFSVSVDNNDRATVRFGDGVSGRAPTTNVTITYKTGGGVAGNVDAGQITKVDGTILDVDSNTVTLIVTNPSAASGGADRETAAAIKVNAPLSIRAPRTSVAREDFEIHANEVSGISRSLMLTHEQDPVGIADNSGVLYCVPTGYPPGYPSTAKLDEVRRVFVGDSQARPAFPAPLTFRVRTSRAVYVDLSIFVIVYFNKGVDPATIAAEIRRRMLAFFATTVSDADLAEDLGVEVGAPNPKINFGFYLKQESAASNPTAGYLAVSDIENVVRDTPGVRRIAAGFDELLISATRKIDIADGGTWTSVQTNVRADVPLQDRDFPRLDYIAIRNGDTGDNL